MAGGKHYGFWAFPIAKTWGLFLVILDIILSQCAKFQLVTNLFWVLVLFHLKPLDYWREKYLQKGFSKNSSPSTARIRCYLNQSTADILFNSFILSQFNYCPLVWMFCDMSSHRLIKTTYRRALSVKHNDVSLSDCNYLSCLNLPGISCYRGFQI